MAKEYDNTALESYLTVAKEAAERAGQTLLSLRNNGSLSIRFKSDRDPVTNADTAAESLIISHIRSQFPDHLFLAEESFPRYESLESFRGAVWVIDPLDGTVNYSHGLAHSSVSIALAMNGEVVVGVVYSPFLGELFAAKRGGGATLNGEKIQASSATDMKQALVTTGFPYGRDNMDLLLERLRSVLLNCQDVRRFGSAAIDISYVACGRIDGFYESLQPWDIAAACLIAQESGARIGHFGPPTPANLLPEGLNGNNLLVASKGVFDALQEILS